MSTEAWRDYGGMLFAAGFIIIGAWALWETRAFTPLGAIFPRAIASTMIVFAASYVVVAILKPLLGKDSRSAESTPRRVLLGVLMVAWIAALSVLGFFTSSLIAFVLLMVISNYDRWTPFHLIVYPITAVCVVAGFYALFAYALKVPLPTGLFF